MTITQRTDDLAYAVGKDMGLLIGRLSDIERTLSATQPVELPALELPGNDIRYTVHPSVINDLGFVDLGLSDIDYSAWGPCFDGMDLIKESSLNSAILISVWTDAKTDDYGGWWGDSYNDKPVAESKLYTLLGKSATVENVRLGISYVKHSLQWLIDESWITSLDVNGEAQSNDSGQRIFAFKIEYIQKDGTRLTTFL